jgi:hypothetical protein
MMETLPDIIRRIVGEQAIDSFVAEVDTVNGRTCDVLPLDGAALKKVRLNTELAKDVGLLITPVKGSKVLVSMLSEVDGFVSLFSEIEKVQLVIGETTLLVQEDTAEMVMGKTKITIKDGEVEMNIGEALAKVSGNKFTVKNSAYSLKGALNELIAELKAAIITTPVGPGSMAPSTVAKLVIIDQKVNQLLS